MSLISDIFKGGAEGVLAGIGTLARDIRIAITGEDPIKKAEIELKLLEIEFISRKAQADINLVEAKHPNLFVAGARPFILWVCGIGLAWQFIVYPLFVWVLKLIGSSMPLPELDTDGLIFLLVSLLGLGGLRTYEKLRGVQGRH